MAAAAAGAAAAAAAAIQAVAANQQAIRNILVQQQAVLQKQMDKQTSSKSEPAELEKGTHNYNLWVLGVSSHLAHKKREWALELSDAAMLAHANYPSDSPPQPLIPGAQAVAQLLVDEARRKVQTELHELLIRTCKETYFTECLQSKVSTANCGSLLWRAIYL